MSKAQVGSTVKVAYIGKLEDGSIFDQSEGDEYLEFVIGEKQLLPGFENALVDMNVNDTKQVFIPCVEAYGEFNPDHITEVTRSMLPDNMIPEVGQRMQAQNDNGDPILVTITELKKNTIVLDANHFLAGKDLTFDITLKEIVTTENS